MLTSEPPVSENEKRDALDAALNSHTFARSAQLRALLRYICEREMAGHSDNLTEYEIAVDVLGRRKDFSLTEDSSVRNRAYELRQRLEKYYSSEQSQTALRIQIPRGGYVPYYTRAVPAAVPETKPALELHERTRRFPLGALAAVAVIASVLGYAGGWLLTRQRPPQVLKEAWGPLSEPGDQLLISIATNFHMMVRPHIQPHPWRFPAPEQLYSIYGSNRPLQPGTPIYMEPAQLSVPLAELAAAATLSNMRTAFGGTYQILPESESPAAALRGRNSFLIGSGTNSRAASMLLRNLALTIDYTDTEQFGVIDQRKPAGQNILFVSQPTGDPVASVQYGLFSVITAADSSGRARRTVVLSGSGSAGVQAAVEFFCSPARMRELRGRLQAAGLPGFPPTYQVVVRCETSGTRLISYEYATHVVSQPAR